MFCSECGKEIKDNSIVCEFCGNNLLPEKENKKKFNVKDFILKYGRKIIDIDTYIWFGIILIIMFLLWCVVIACFIPDKNGYFEFAEYLPLYLALSIIIPLIMLVILIITKYLIYVLIDIRDSLQEIRESKNEKMP